METIYIYICFIHKIYVYNISYIYISVGEIQGQGFDLFYDPSGVDYSSWRDRSLGEYGWNSLLMGSVKQ